MKSPSIMYDTNLVVNTLQHIYHDCNDIQSFIYDITEEEFIRSNLHVNAVSMSIISIGELVKILP